MKHLGFFLREAAYNTFHHGVLTAAGVLAVTFAALTVGILGLAYWNLRSAYDQARRELYLDVYLKEGLTAERARAVGVHLRRLPGVVKADYVSPEDAAKEFVGLFPEDKDLLAATGDNPLPASYRVYLDPRAVNTAAVEELRKKASSIEGVEEAVYGQEWLEGMDRAARLVGVIGLGVAGVLGVVGMLVVMSTIGVTVYARKDVIAVMKVVGATDGFVQAPFVYEGLFVGALSGVLAWGLLTGGVMLLRQQGLDISPVPWHYGAAGVVGTSLVGALGSLISVRRFLTV